MHHHLRLKEPHLPDLLAEVLKEDQQENRPSDLLREDRLQEEFDEGLRQLIKERHQLEEEQHLLLEELRDQQLGEELHLEGKHHRREDREDLHEDLQQRPEGLLGLELLLEVGHVLQDVESLLLHRVQGWSAGQDDQDKCSLVDVFGQ